MSIMRMKRKGRILAAIRSMASPPTLDAMNIFKAMGGVIIPTEVLTIMRIPSNRGLKPIDAAMGNSMGVNNRMMALVSKKTPKSSRTMLSNSKITILFEAMDNTVVAMVVGIWAAVNNQAKLFEVAIINRTMAVLNPALIRISGNIAR